MLSFFAWKFVSYEIPFTFETQPAFIEVLQPNTCDYKERKFKGIEIAFYFNKSASLLCVPVNYTAELNNWSITSALQLDQVKYIRYCNQKNQCIYRNQKNNHFSFELKHQSSFMRPGKPVF